MRSLSSGEKEAGKHTHFAKPLYKRILAFALTGSMIIQNAGLSQAEIIADTGGVYYEEPAGLLSEDETSGAGTLDMPESGYSADGDDVFGDPSQAVTSENTEDGEILCTSDELLEDDLSDDYVAGDFLPENITSEDFLSDDTASEDLLAEGTNSEDLISEDLTSEDFISEDFIEAGNETGNGNAVTEEAASDMENILDEQEDDASGVQAAEVSADNSQLFSYAELNGSYIKITGYTGEEKTVNVPEKIGSFIVQEIGSSAFAGKGIEEISIPATVERIGSDAFSKCASLSKVNLSDSIISIGNAAFMGCTSLKDIDLPDSLETIGERAFMDCTGLKQIEYPDSVKYIGWRAFRNCTSLEKANYPLSLESTGGNVYEYDEKLTSITVPEGVTELASSAFASMSQLTEVKLPSTLAIIKEAAFLNCTSLPGIELPENLLEIRERAFMGCTGFTSVHIPDKVMSIGWRAFRDCPSLSDINYPKSLVSAGGSLYENDKSLTKITVPDGVKDIPGSAFSSCNYLEEVILPSTLKTIGNSAFQSCPSLLRIDLPEGLNSIGENSFSSCTSLKTVKLPDSVTEIGWRAFRDCTAINSVQMPKGFSRSGGSIFENCSELRSITIPEGIEILPDSALSSGNCLEKITLPESLKVIGNSAFAYMSKAERLILPENVTTINYRAFESCTKLKQIWIGPSVVSIHNEAFRNCSSELEIHGEEGSYAQSFAESKGITFVASPVGAEDASLAGRLVDESGSGIPGAGISIYYVDKKEYRTEETDENGNWAHEEMEKGLVCRIRYTHPDYSFEDNDQTVTVTGDVRLPDVVGKRVFDAMEASPVSDFAYEKLTGGKIRITKYNGSSKTVVIPDQIEDLPVSEIGGSAFAGNSTLEAVKLPKDLKTVGSQAFSGCTSLSTVRFNAKTVVIGDAAFLKCSSIEKIELPGTLETISERAFMECSGLKEIMYPASVKYIGWRAFRSCSNLEKANYPVSLESTGGNVYEYDEKLTSITVPEGVTELAASAFASMSQLKEVKLPSTLTVIKDAAFLNCTSLPGIELPESLQEIRERAFMGCSSFTSLHIPDGVRSIGWRAFRDCPSLSDINYPKSLESTGGSLYENDKSLTKITVPDGVKNIPGSAFSACNYLEEVILPSTLETIGNSAFQSCPSLKRIDLPEGLNKIGENSFSSCTSLKTVKIPDSVTEIGWRAFRGCTALNSVQMSKGFSRSGGSIFENCNELKSITIPEGIETLPDSALSSGNCLERITLPMSLKVIGNSSFANVSKAERLILPENVTTINYRAFESCTKLKQIWIGPSVTSIHNEAFRNCSSELEIHGEEGSYAQSFAESKGITFIASPVGTEDASLAGRLVDESGSGIPGAGISVYYVDKKEYRTEETDENGNWTHDEVEDGTVCEIHYTHPDYSFEDNDKTVTATGEVRIPDVVGKKVFDAMEAAPATDFAYEKLTGGKVRITKYKGSSKTVVIPDQIEDLPVTEIGSSAFADNRTLEAVKLPKELTTVGNQAFSGCTVLSTVRFNAKTVVIGDAAFLKCSSIKEIELPGTLETISERAFMECSGLKEIMYPASVKYIGWRAFRSCPNLEKANYPLSLESTGGNVYEYDEKLTSITVPEGVTELAASAFASMSQLKEVKLPSTLTVIKDAAFLNCTSLPGIELPESLVEIRERAFMGCSSFTSVHIPDSVRSIGWRAFRDCPGLAEVNYPKSLEYSGGSIFENDKSLTFIRVPDGVKKIPASAFSNSTYLEEIALPSGLEMIDNNAFQGCQSLVKAELPEGLRAIGENSFNSCISLKEIRIPDSVTDIGWRAFRGCRLLSNVNYPLGLVNAGTGIFENCESLRTITIPENITYIPRNVFSSANYLRYVYLPSSVKRIEENAFSYCDGLPAIALNDGLEVIETRAFRDCDGLISVIIPDTVTSLKASSFANCRNLEQMVIPDSVTAIDGNAFESCPKIVIYCHESSYAAIYAVQHGIPFVFIDEGKERDGILVSDKTRYSADLNGLSINGCVSFKAEYEIRAEEASGLSDYCITISLPSNVEFTERYVKVNGVKTTDYILDDNGMLMIPVKDNSGTVTFSAVLREQRDLVSYASFSYVKDSITKTETIGVIKEYISGITIDAPSVTGVQTFTVSGTTTPSFVVELFIDGTKAGNARASKAGQWIREITIPSPADGRMYRIEAVSKDSEGKSISAGAYVTYRAGEPVIKSLIMKYWEHSLLKECDVLNSDYIRPLVYYVPGTKFVFEAEFTNPSKITELYITSTRNGITRYMPAKYDSTSGKFITDGFFDENNHNYMPGIISYVYNQKPETVYVDTSMDWEKLYSMLPDNVKKNPPVTVKKNTPEEYRSVVDLSVFSEELKGVFMNTGIEIFDEYSGSSIQIGKWKGLIEELDNMLGYMVEGYDDSKYLITLDYSDPQNILMLVKDISGNKFIGFTLEAMMDNAEDLDKFATINNIATVLSTTNQIASLLYDNYKIEKDMDDLRKDVMSSTSYSSVEERSEALRKVDELEIDQKKFLIMMTILPLLVAAPAVGIGATMTAPAILATGMLGLISAMSVFFWEARKADILGQKYKIRFIADPSGYVYDLTTGEPIENVTASAFWIPNSDEEDFWEKVPDDSVYGTLWEAADYNQMNPLYTNPDGKYAWDVPEGWWRVRFEKEGYETAWTDWMTVPPIQTDINIGLQRAGGAHTEHKWDKGTVTVKATCKQTGIMEYHCLDCGITKTEIIPLAAHTYGEWKTVKAATAAEPGMKERTCTVCGHKEQEEIPKTERKLFKDVTDPSLFYYEPIYWAVDKGITTGFNDNTFRPMSNCNRAAVVTFLWRMAGKPEPKTMASFVDMTGNTDFDKAISWALEEGITTGWKTDNTFRPWTTCNRAAIVTFLWRFAGKPEPSKMAEFADMTGTSDFDKAISWAAEKGITTGYPADNTFRPWNQCLRLAIVSFLYRYAAL